MLGGYPAVPHAGSACFNPMTLTLNLTYVRITLPTRARASPIITVLNAALTYDLNVAKVSLGLSVYLKNDKSRCLTLVYANLATIRLRY